MQSVYKSVKCFISKSVHNTVQHVVWFRNSCQKAQPGLGPLCRIYCSFTLWFACDWTVKEKQNNKNVFIRLCQPVLTLI